MTLQMKLIIPLLDKSLTKEDISPEAGFFGAYNADINKPYYDNCIFLMYTTDMSNTQARLTEYKLRKLESIAHRYLVYINKICYRVYAFSIVNTDIKHLLQGMRHFKTDSYLRFVQFWGITDGLVNHYLTCPNVHIEHEVVSIPEEDYNPTLEEVIKNRKGLNVPYGAPRPF